jgi:hypothetical protein
MACASCGDKGIIRVNWLDAPEDFALCLCATGLLMRRTVNVSAKVTHDGYPLWMAWAERERVDPERVWGIEDVLDSDELTARGFMVQPPDEDAITSAGKVGSGTRGTR